MKKTGKIAKIAASVCLAGAVCAGCAALSGCAWTTQTAEGEYHYTNYGVEYGVKVSVEVQNDEKGERIRKVTIIDSGYTQLSDAKPDYGWTDEDRQVYIDGEQALLDTYRGKDVVEVLSMNVNTDAIGQPTSADSSVTISGATQSSGRLLLAVQDALCNYGYSILYGQYHYPNAWAPTAPHYGIKVKLVMKGNVIKRVLIADSDFVSVTDSWEDKAIWNDGIDELLASYVGLTKTEVMHMSVTTSEGGQPESVSDGAPVITGATQGSGRLLLAIQNALDHLNYADSPEVEEEPDEPDEPSEGWTESEYIDVDATTYEVEGTSVKYNIVTLANAPAQPFTVTMTVGEDKKVSDFAIVVNGSKPESFADKMAAMAELINGKGVDELKALLEDKAIATGATRSNELCVYAAIFAAANYDIAMGNEQPGEDDPAYDWQAVGSDWAESEYIDAARSQYAVDGKNVAYKIVTLQYDPAQPFTVTMKVGEDKKVSDFAIVVNGSKPESFADNMAAMAELINGKGVDELKALLEDKAIATGATRSNKLCVYAAIFAAANYDIAMESILPDGQEVSAEGEYHYPNAWSPTAPHYGIKVKVTVIGNTIVSVSILDSDYVSVTDSWENKDLWINGVDELLAAYKGMTIADVMGEVVTTSEGGQPEKVENADLMITGATQGSGRLLLAVQNALTNLPGYEVVTGEYHYPNAWSPDAPHYGIKVNVAVYNGTVVSVSVVDSDYVSVTDTWESKDIWLNGLDELLAAYNGRTVEAVLAEEVVTSGVGQPDKVENGELMITGATQGSGRLLLAVQNALEKLA